MNGIDIILNDSLHPKPICIDLKTSLKEKAIHTKVRMCKCYYSE